MCSNESTSDSLNSGKTAMCLLGQYGTCVWHRRCLGVLSFMLIFVLPLSQALSTCTSSLCYDRSTLLQIRNSMEQFSANWGHNFLPPPSVYAELSLGGLLLPPLRRRLRKRRSRAGVQVWLRRSRRLLPGHCQEGFTSYLRPISLQALEEDNEPQPLTQDTAASVHGMFSLRGLHVCQLSDISQLTL